MNIKKFLGKCKKILFKKVDLSILTRPIVIKKSNSKDIKKSRKTKRERNKLQMRLSLKEQKRIVKKLEKDIAFLNKKIDNDKELEERLKKYIDGNETKYENFSNANNDKIISELNSIKELINSTSEKLKEQIKIETQQELDKVQEKIKEETLSAVKNIKKEIVQDVIITTEEMNEIKIKIQKEMQQKIDDMQQKIKGDAQQEIDTAEEKIKAETQQEIFNIKSKTRREIEKIQSEVKQEIESKVNQIQNEIKDGEFFYLNEDITYDDLVKMATYIIPLKKETSDETQKNYDLNMMYMFRDYLNKNIKEGSKIKK